MSTVHTKLCDLLRVEVPILSAPMGGNIAGPELAAAVSNAGGLGIMAASSGNDAIALKDEIRRLRSITDRPVGVGVLLRNQAIVETVIDVCVEEGVPFLMTFWGDPTPYVTRAHSGGMKVIDQVGSVEHAYRSVRAGVDVIVAQGVEAGGHIDGEVTTMALVPRVVDEVDPIPVVAAGGIADARGFVAALALGAQGVLLGSRFIATHEANAHPVYKQKILEASESQTVRTTLFGFGWPNAPHRTLRTPFVERWLPEEHRGSEQRPDEPLVGERMTRGKSVPLLRFMGAPPNPDTTGDLESMDFLAGQGVGLIREIRSAGEVVSEFAAGARKAISNLVSGNRAPEE